MGTKISELNIQTPADGTEYVECIIPPYTAGTNRRITTQDIANLAGGGGAVDSVNGQTGVVVLTKTDVGLGNADNTSDVNKPVSTAQQTALDLKANLASPTFTGIPAAPTAAAGTSTTQVATTAFVNQSKFVYYANDYGLIADSNGTTGNGTDNAAALGSLIDLVLANGGGTIRLGVGTYRYTGIISKVGSNVTIEGSGIGHSKLFCDNTAVNEPSMKIVGSNIHYRHFTLLGRRTFSSSGHGLNISGNYGSVEFVEVDGSNCFGIMVGNSAKYVTIMGSSIHNSAADGMHVELGAQFVNIINNHIFHCADDGIGIGFGGAASYVNIIGNTIYETSAGVAVMGYSTGSGDFVAGVHHIVVSNNNISNTWLAGVFLSIVQGSLEDVTVSGNIINNPGGFAPVSDVIMRGVGVAGGIMLRASGLTVDHTMRGVKINDNIINNARNTFITVGFIETGNFIGKVRDIQVNNNICKTISNAGGAGNWGFGATGSSNNPNDGKYPGISIQYVIGGIDVSNNKMRGASQECVYASANATGGLAIKGNDCAQGNIGGVSSYAFDVLANTSSTIVTMTDNFHPSGVYGSGIARITAGCSIINKNSPAEFRNAQSGTTYTVLPNDINKTIGLTNTAARTITLPSAAQYPAGIPFTLKDEAGTAGAANITVNRAGSDTVNGGTSFTMSTNYQSTAFYSNGSNAWFTR